MEDTPVLDSDMAIDTEETKMECADVEMQCEEDETDAPVLSAEEEAAAAAAAEAAAAEERERRVAAAEARADAAKRRGASKGGYYAGKEPAPQAAPEGGSEASQATPCEHTTLPASDGSADIPMPEEALAAEVQEVDAEAAASEAERQKRIAAALSRTEAAKRRGASKGGYFAGTEPVGEGEDMDVDVEVEVEEPTENVAEESTNKDTEQSTEEQAAVAAAAEAEAVVEAERQKRIEAALSRTEAAKRRGGKRAKAADSTQPPPEPCASTEAEAKPLAAPEQDDDEITARRQRALAAEQRLKAMQGRGKGPQAKPRTPQTPQTETPKAEKPKPATQDALRELRAEQAQARLAAQQGRSKPKPKTHGIDMAAMQRELREEAQKNTTTPTPTSAPPPPPPSASASATPEPETKTEERAPREMSDVALAALARANKAPSNMSQESKDALSERRAKDEILGRIEAVSKRKGLHIPFSLPARPVAALRQYLAQIQGDK